MGPLLRPLPTRKNPLTYKGTVVQIRTNIPTFRARPQTFRARPHRPGLPPTGISRLLLPTHGCRPFHSLARSCPHPEDQHVYGSPGVHSELGSQVWRTVAHDFRQRSTVRVGILVQHEQFTRYGFASDNFVPPSSKRSY